MFKGSMTALITPFKNGAVDEKGFQDFCSWQIDEGTDALVPVGTTGESPDPGLCRAQTGDRPLRRGGATAACR